MNKTSPMTLLLRRARNSLWRWRLGQSLWYGVCGAALLLLPAAFLHLLWVPVTPGSWLPLALAPVGLAGLYALLWQRPAPDAVAAALDREGGHQELFISALEAYNMPARTRGAGPRAVLRQVAKLAPAVEIPSRWLSLPRCYARFQLLPWAVVMASLFLLQLPPVKVEHRARPASSGGYPELLAGAAPVPVAGSASRAPANAGDTPASAPPQDLESIQLALADELPEQAVAFDGKQSALARLEQSQDTGSADTDNPGAATADRTDSDGTGAARGSGMGADRGGEGSRGEAEVSTDAPRAVQYADIARKGGGATTMPGADTLALAASASATASPGAVAVQPAPPPALAQPDTRRFSLGQRQQLAYYFEQIQELP